MERNGNRSSKIEAEFFDWLLKNIDRIFAEEKIQKAVTEKLATVNSKIRWEVGPWSENMNFFAFSPNLNDDLFAITENLASHAPTIQRWIFLSSKPRKQWNSRSIQIKNSEGISVKYNLDSWQYYLTSFQEGEFFDINFVPYGHEDKQMKELEHIGSLLSEFELGEELFMKIVDRVNIIHPSQLEYASNKIENLYDQILFLKK